ncbi:MAG TPA: choice-of-anchor tandem repeat GloVer-containing protein [Candidatus Babeliales bacterium]|nr:choice-of-anchor tandem repeat GloVer-containing protein [Candidatus Babeliales bacterium]
MLPGDTPSQTRPQQSSNFATIYQFPKNVDGSNPVGGLLNLNDVLYGTTYFGGTKAPGMGVAYQLSLPTSGKPKEIVMHKFAGGSYDAAKPYAGLTPADCTASMSCTLYGTSQEGGTYSDGTVYSLVPGDQGSEGVTYSFSGPPNDGKNPRASLLNVDGVLYGTTYYGGAADLGTVFAITTGSSSVTETVIHSFTGGSGDGALPLGPLINVNGALYGTTSEGGPNDDGTVFEIPLSTSGGGEQLLYSFTGAPDGAKPYAGLTAVNGSPSGALYGTTYEGGVHNKGTIFELSTSGAESVLYSFAGEPDGKLPTAGLTLLNGILYGATAHGGAHNKGTIFEVLPSGGENVLYSFTGGADGYNPYNTLIASGGALYGTTLFGGAGTGAMGTVFEYFASSSSHRR